MRRARVLLADDHTIVVQGLARLLKDEFDLVGSVGDGAALVEAARELRPDVIVADISMPELSGLEALRRLKEEGIDAHVLFLTAYGDPQLAAEAIRAGAAGYLLKHSAGEELVTAIQEALQGRVYLTPLITKDVIAAMTSPPEQPESAVKLAPRQQEVLRLIAEGLTMKQIASTLQLSRRTVEGYKYEMMEALEVETTPELIRTAIRLGLLEP
jgi:DNA-binding NarL/FixJ family response regulator